MSTQFEFAVGEGHWLEVPVDATNIVRHSNGAKDHLIDKNEPGQSLPL